jgi:hypothetical protein
MRPHPLGSQFAWAWHYFEFVDARATREHWSIKPVARDDRKIIKSCESSRSQFSVADCCAVRPRVARAETHVRFVFDHDALRVAHVERLGGELVTAGFERSARVGR